MLLTKILTMYAIIHFFFLFKSNNAFLKHSSLYDGAVKYSRSIWRIFYTWTYTNETRTIKCVREVSWKVQFEEVSMTASKFYNHGCQTDVEASNVVSFGFDTFGNRHCRFLYWFGLILISYSNIQLASIKSTTFFMKTLFFLLLLTSYTNWFMTSVKCIDKRGLINFY